ncbi:MAG TPA: hypothetical protein VMW93_07675 [bacterium]|nr:hypothetical protein [bacterium]
MKTAFAAALALAAAVSPLRAADLVVERAPTLAGSAANERDSSIVLSWDNSSSSWLLAWTLGADAWVGNDFDVSTLKTFSRIREMRISCYYMWPNRVWDGFRVGVFAFEGNVPGSLMWPTSGGGQFFLPLSTQSWQTISMYWVLPGGRRSFVAAMEQCYNFPNCDPYVVDNNPTFRGHSWQHYGGRWQPLEGTYGYRNLMLRVVVENMVGLLPSSIGRVKALYH